MSRARIFRYFISLALIAALAGCLVGSGMALAQEETTSTESLEVETKFPVLSGESGDSFSTEVDVKYKGSERKRLDLTFSTPPNWMAYAESSYPKKQVAAIELGPAEAYEASETLTVTFSPVLWYYPDPGEYVVTLTVSSGDLSQSIDLTAKVTAKYGLDMTTETGRLNIEVTAGSDNHFTIVLVNTGTADIEDITFTSSKPEGWNIDFMPQKVESLDFGTTSDVDVVINPPKGKTIAGDYAITINANSKKVNDDIELRITVLTPSIWGWVGIAIVVVVIAGLAVIFRQLGRR